MNQSQKNQRGTKGRFINAQILKIKKSVRMIRLIADSNVNILTVETIKMRIKLVKLEKNKEWSSRACPF